MAKKQFKTWDQYTDEAQIEPYELPVSKDEVLVFENPSGIALTRIMRGLRTGDLELILTSLAGDNWPRLEELFAQSGHGALPALTEDLMEHFKLYEPVTLIGPGGGKVIKRKPREIQALINQGYRPAGEVPAS